MDAPGSLSADDFYSEYHGHQRDHLKTLLDGIRSHAPDSSIAYLAGDSSLDNKYWFDKTGPAVGVYSKILEPPESCLDVAYHMNAVAIERSIPLVTINAAREESTIGDRSCGALHPQDEFIRDNIRAQDILVVSVGGNDIALKPSCCTGLNMLCLTKCCPMCWIEHSCGWVWPCDDCCLGCGPSCCSTITACPPCIGYFQHLFGSRVKNYLNQLTAVTKPKAVLLLMIYYPDEAQTGSWADTTLGILGYNDNPSKLQLLIKKVFEQATSQVSMDGTRVIPVPLFEALDGKTSSDYAARVEPSATGGRKMADLILDKFVMAYGVEGHATRS